MPGSEVVFKPREAGWETLLRSPTGPLGQWYARKGNRMVTAAKGDANVDTGQMRSRIEFRVEVEARELVGVLAARTSYAVHVHDGTRYYRGNPFLVNAVRSVL